MSVASVSRALNGHENVTRATRTRILAAATHLRYTPNDAARSLITKRTQTIGAVLPDLHGEFFSELIRGIDVAARGHGLHLLVSSSHGDAEEAAAALRAMQGRVDGLLVMSPHVDVSFLRANLPDTLPAVMMNAVAGSTRYPTLNIDNYGGAFAMTKHLIDNGRRRVALIAGPEGNLDAGERLRGYRDALASTRPALAARVLAGDFSEESGYRAGLALIGTGDLPDAVFAANDMMAIGCLFAFLERGLQVPGDLALCGFDDIPIARFVTPPLTTVRVRIADLGRCALDTLLGALDAPGTAQAPSQTLPCEVVVRASCGIPSRKPDPDHPSIR